MDLSTELGQKSFDVSFIIITCKLNIIEQKHKYKSIIYHFASRPRKPPSHTKNTNRFIWIGYGKREFIIDKRRTSRSWNGTTNQDRGKGDWHGAVVL